MDDKVQQHYLFASTIFASKEQYIVNTVLGSCVSVCLFDPERKIGGINHFMLPLWNGDGLATPQYGNIAIEKLIEKMRALGAQEKNLEAKIFGGANQIFTSVINIGERNYELANVLLMERKIRIVAQHVGGQSGRKIRFNTNTGEVAMKLLSNA